MFSTLTVIRNVFSETRADYLKNSTCYACSKKGHLVYNCKSTCEPKKKEILDIMKSGDFKPPKSGVVNTNVQKDGDGDDDPPKNGNDCEKFVDSMGADNFNVGELE